jgi:hypothetical protein
MTEEQALAEFRYLWEPPHQYVLLRVGGAADRLVIFDPIARQLTLICEDDELNALVIRRMVAAGVQVLDDLPPMS